MTTNTSSSRAARKKLKEALAFLKDAAYLVVESDTCLPVYSTKYTSEAEGMIEAARHRVKSALRRLSEG